MLKAMFVAAGLCAVSIASFASVSSAPVLTVNFSNPTKPVYVEFDLNGHNLGVTKISGSGNATYFNNSSIKKLSQYGFLHLQSGNTLNFSQCSNRTCTTKKLAQQSTYRVSIKKIATDVYQATPNMISVKLK